MRDSHPGSAIDPRRLPDMFRVAHTLPRPVISDRERVLRDQLERQAGSVTKGAKIAVAVGSRGIANVSEIVRTLVSWLASKGAEPFVVPAMGSHGGATAEGQAQILADYGVREDLVGCPIRSSMEVVELPRGGCPARVFQDRNVSEADGIVLVNRVKPHTDFHGPYESGLMKMLAIGLGKQVGAVEIHRLGVTGLRDVMPKVAACVLGHSRVLFGVALVENAYEETARIEVIPGSLIPSSEPPLLQQSRELMPRLPVDDLDILLVDEIGKDISGVGMDTNVIGRLAIRGEPEFEPPRIGAIVARSLTPASHGNAIGVGLADVVTRRLVDAIDFSAMYENLYAATFFERGKIPITLDTDAAALTFALRACRLEEVSKARIIRIPNTRAVSLLHASTAVVEELRDRSEIEVLGPVTPAWFDERGELGRFW